MASAAATTAAPILRGRTAPGAERSPWGKQGAGLLRLCPPAARIEPVLAHRPARLPASTYRRRRAAAAGLVVLLVVLVGAALGTLGGGPLLVPERPGALSVSDAGPAGRIYVVQPGDTFWTIATRLKPSGDPRPLVDRLVAAHGGSTLHVGERIPVPFP
jgi:hypothetical protein